MTNPLTTPWYLVDAVTGRVVIASLAVADRFWPRLVGLQFRRRLPAGRGLLLVPCASVHTMWLRFPLDLAMLGDGGTVLAVRRSVRPWRGALAPRGTRAVLEATGGTLALSAGDCLALAGTDLMPPSLLFLSVETKVGLPA